MKSQNTAWLLKMFPESGNHFPNMTSPNDKQNCFCLKYGQLNLQMEEVVVGKLSSQQRK